MHRSMFSVFLVLYSGLAIWPRSSSETKTSKLDNLPSGFSNNNYNPLYNLAYDVQPSCKFSLKSFQWFRRSCTYKMYRNTDRYGDPYTPTKWIMYNCKIIIKMLLALGFFDSCENWSMNKISKITWSKMKLLSYICYSHII